MLGRLIKNTWDCLRYPFLYPRNRFTGLHYNNWEILDWIRKKEKESSIYVNLSPTTEEILEGREYWLTPRKYLGLELDGNKILVVLKTPGGCWERVLKTFEFPGKVYDVSWFGSNGVIKVKTDQPPKNRFIGGRIIYSPFKYLGAKIVEFFHSWPIQLFHCLPEGHTELDALEKGWRRAFGEDLCKNLKKALLKEGGLKSLYGFRISQIKEKWGYLHFYHCGGGEEVSKVIDKYEKISRKTCICCGKPATWVTTGWISPYCDDCVGDQVAERIDEKEEGL